MAGYPDPRLANSTTGLYLQNTVGFPIETKTEIRHHCTMASLLQCCLQKIKTVS